MPIFEYKCRSCGHQFEKIVRGSQTPECSSCQSTDLEKLFSMPGVSTEKSRRRLEQQAKQIRSKVQRDQAHAHSEFVRKELNEHK